jgi:hypothetical protein
VKVPDTLDALLDLMRAKGVATFEWEERGEGGTVLKHSLGMETWRMEAPGGWKLATNVPGFNGTVMLDATPQNIAAPDIAPKPVRVSDIELALNPPTLDYDAPDEEADIAETVASLEAPREKAPVGAAEPDDKP